MTNEEPGRELYEYSGRDILRNKLDIRDPVQLDLVERRLVAKGDLDPIVW